MGQRSRTFVAPLVMAALLGACSESAPTVPAQATHRPTGTTTRHDPSYALAFIREGNIYLVNDREERRLTSTGGFRDISWSHLGDSLVAVRGAAIVRVGVADGSVTSFDIGARGPTLVAASPIAEKLAFVALDDENLQQVWLRDVPSQNTQQLTRLGPSDDAGGEPAFTALNFSASGGAILVTAGRRSDFSHLKQYDAVTGEPMPVRDGPAAGQASLDREGRLWWAEGGFEEGNFQTSISIHRGSDGVILAGDPQRDYLNPMLSPDGTALAFVIARRSGSSAVWISRPDGRIARQLAGNARDPEWNPRGTSLSLAPSRAEGRAWGTEIVEDRFTLTVPAGWKRYKRSGTRPREFGYSNGKGLYLKVLVWRAGTTCCHFFADSVWHLTYIGPEGRFVVDERDPPCRDPEDPYCPRGNGQLDLYAFARDGGPDEYTDIDVHFEFGYTHRESGVNTTVFQRIIESFRLS